jgi:hypothetical protein
MSTFFFVIYQQLLKDIDKLLDWDCCRRDSLTLCTNCYVYFIKFYTNFINNQNWYKYYPSKIWIQMWVLNYKITHLNMQMNKRHTCAFWLCQFKFMGASEMMMMFTYTQFIHNTNEKTMLHMYNTDQPKRHKYKQVTNNAIKVNK